MVLDNISSSPHRKSVNPFPSTSFKRQFLSRDEWNSCSALYKRHQFLISMMGLLFILCTIYLYFAVTFSDECADLTGSQETLCRLEKAKASVKLGKLKFF